MHMLFLVAVLASCAKEPTGEITLSTDHVDMTAAGGEIKLTVNANFPWTGNCGTSDVVMSTKTGDTGQTDMTVLVPGNPESSERTIEVKFNCGNAKAKLTIVQNGSEFKFLTLSHTNDSFGLPLFEGTGFTGTVTWGDGASDTFSAFSEIPIHTYEKAEDHLVEIKVHDTGGFTVVSMQGVKSVDISGF